MRPTLYGSRHAVSAGHYLAAAAGHAILEAGGNAKVKAIMVSDLKRNDLMPGVPTAEEAGLKGFTDGSWFGLLAPAGTPPDVIKKIYAAVTQAVQNPKNQKKFKDIGLTVQEEGPEKFQATVISESDLWKKEANSLGVSAD